MAYQVVSQPGNPDSGITNPREAIAQEAYAKRAKDAGYAWDPVQKKWLKAGVGPGTAYAKQLPTGQWAYGSGGGSGGNVSTSMAGLQAAAGNNPLDMGGRTMPGGGGGGGTGTPVGDIAPIDTTAADEAAFARAKDVAGQTGRASLESLRGLMGETGQLGGGAETQATRDIVESAAGQVGDVNREQAIQKSERGFQTALANQQAKLTQRGQDLGAQGNQAQLAMAQIQLQFQQAQAQSQRQLELLKLALSQANTASSALY